MSEIKRTTVVSPLFNLFFYFLIFFLSFALLLTVLEKKDTVASWADVHPQQKADVLCGLHLSCIKLSPVQQAPQMTFLH